MNPPPEPRAGISDLAPGRRLAGSAGSSYVVVGPAWDGPRKRLFRARKVLENYRFPDRRRTEADADEWLDVLVRVPIRDDDGRFAFERERVLALPDVPWMLEPLDVIDGPALVLADPHAARLDTSALTTENVERLARELLAMLDGLHRHGLAAGGLDEGDFLIDGSGRWFYAGTDRIVEAATPEAARDDLAAWAALIAPWAGGSASAWLRSCLERAAANPPASVAELVEGPTLPRRALDALRRAFGPRQGG